MTLVKEPLPNLGTLNDLPEMVGTLTNNTAMPGIDVTVGFDSNEAKNTPRISGKASSTISIGPETTTVKESGSEVSA